MFPQVELHPPKATVKSIQVEIILTGDLIRVEPLIKKVLSCYLSPSRLKMTSHLSLERFPINLKVPALGGAVGWMLTGIKYLEVLIVFVFLISEEVDSSEFGGVHDRGVNTSMHV